MSFAILRLPHEVTSRFFQVPLDHADFCFYYGWSTGSSERDLEAPTPTKGHRGRPVPLFGAQVTGIQYLLPFDGRQLSRLLYS